MAELIGYEDQAVDAIASEPVEVTPPAKLGILKLECGCGHVSNVSEEEIKDGLSFTMLIDDNSYITLKCAECGASLKLFIDEIKEENELPEESNKE